MADGSDPVRINKVDTRLHNFANGWPAMLFGLPFLAVGALFSIGSFLELDFIKEGANAPLWVIGMVGLMFFLAGLYVFMSGFVGFIRMMRVRRLKKRFPGQPWHYDYAWRGFTVRDDSTRRVLTGLLGFGFVAIFIVPFIWWAFLSDEGTFMVQFIVSVFLVFIVVALLTALYRLAQYLKYGVTQLQFSQFPMFVGETMLVGMLNRDFEKLNVTLRFVEEKMVERVSAGSKKHLVHESYAHYSDTIELVPGTRDFVPISFEVPDKPDWSNQLIADPAVRYWELVVEAEQPGIDFRTTFALPIYHVQDKSTRRNGNFGRTKAHGR